MPVRGLTVVATRPEALRAGLELVAANAALGGRARLFAQGEAVAALALPLRAPHDEDYRAAGLPTLAELFGEAWALGVEISACQSGLALLGLTADMLDERVTYGGPVSVLQSIEDDRLATI
jgi:predicted peroxiredoxin